MSKKKKTQLFTKAVIILVPFFILLLITNFITFTQPQLDQFNILHRYDKTYSILDWNLPHFVREFVDKDRKTDILIYNGCIFLSTMKKSSIPSGRECYNNLVENGKLKGYQLPMTNKRVFNFYLGKKNNNLDMVVYSIEDTELYEITPLGEIKEKRAPLSLKIDSLLYSVSHLYVFII